MGRSRLRIPFAAAFGCEVLLAAYLGLSDVQLAGSDKLWHAGTFFALTLTFYWIVDASRRRAANATAAVCTGALGVGSEFVQALANPRRAFDARRDGPRSARRVPIYVLNRGEAS